MRELGQRRLGALLMTPAMLLLVLTAVIPIGYVLYQSTQDIRGIMNFGFVGLGNYTDLIREGRLQSAIVATVLFGVATIGIQMTVGMLVALALNVRFRGRTLVRTIILIPWAIPTAIVGLMWSRFLASTDGYVNAVLRMMGLLEGEFNWFLERFLAIGTVAVVDSWKFTPIFVLIFLAGLQAIPHTYYEAATVDGAGALKKFFYITLPIMKPVILVALIMRTIFVFHAFDLIYIMTKGGPGDSTRVLSYYAYQESFTFMQHGRGAAVAFILFMFTLLITLVYVRLLRPKEKLVR